MDPNVQEEITRILPRSPGDGRGYYPVLYRPDSTQVISVHARDFHPLAPPPRSELSRQINERNIALVQRRIDAMGDLDPKRILKCYGYRFGSKSFMIVDLDGKEPLSRLVEQSDLNLPEKLKLVCGRARSTAISNTKSSSGQLYETGKAIQYLHYQNPPAVHGAVHPNNILIATPNSAVLSDFGLANVWRLLEPDHTDHGLGSELYYTWLLPRDKVGYTAPEYLMDDTGEMLPPADIYAFASVILAVLSNRHPPTGIRVCSPKGIAAITEGVPPDPEDHPNLPENDSFWPFLQQMWSRNPTDRPTIDEVLKQLDQELRIRGGEDVQDILALEHVVARSHL